METLDIDDSVVQGLNFSVVAITASEFNVLGPVGLEFHELFIRNWLRVINNDPVDVFTAGWNG